MKFSVIAVTFLMMFSTVAFGKFWEVEPCKMTWTEIGAGGNVTTGSGVGCRATLNFRIASPGGGTHTYHSLQEYLASAKLTLEQKAAIEKKFAPLIAKLNDELSGLTTQKFSKQEDFNRALKGITIKYAGMAPEIRFEESRRK